MGVDSLLERLAKKYYGFDKEYFEKHTAESVRLTNQAVDMGLAPETERVVFGEPEIIDGKEQRRFKGGHLFNGLNHFNFAFKHANTKGARPLLQAKEAIQSFYTPDAAVDAANNAAGLNAAKRFKTKEQALFSLVEQRNKKIAQNQPLKSGEDLIFTNDEINNGALYKTLKKTQDIKRNRIGRFIPPKEFRNNLSTGGKVLRALANTRR